MNSVNSVVGNVIQNKCKLNEISVIILVRCYTRLVCFYIFYTMNC